MAAKKQEQKQDIFYVGINNPVKLRRNVLECSKLMIRSLQVYEKVNRIREKRIDKTEKFKSIVRELSRMCNSLKRELPSNKILEMHEHQKKALLGNRNQQHINILPTSPAPSIKQEARKELTNVNKLERDLHEIEQKLKALGH